MERTSATSKVKRRPAKMRSGRVSDRQETLWGILFLLPMIVLVLAFTVYPILGSVQFALYNWSGFGKPTQFVGLRHFITTATDSYFWNAFKNNVFFTVVVVPVQLLIALVLAVILNNPRTRLRVLLRTMFFLPVVTSIVIAATAVRIMLANFGTTVTASLGADPPIDILGSPDFAMWAVIAFGCWYSLGYNLVYFLAALQTVPLDLYDAAKVDGANGWQRMVHITFPSIRPVFIIILFLAILGSLNVFEQSWVLTGGGPFYASDVVAGYIYRMTFSSSISAGGGSANFGRASAAAFFFSALILIITLIQWAINRRLSKREE